MNILHSDKDACPHLTPGVVQKETNLGRFSGRESLPACRSSRPTKWSGKSGR